MRFRALALVAAVGLVATLGTACGDDAKKDAPVYTITAHENGDKLSFDVPDGIQGGVVTLQLVSPKSNKQPHDFQLVKLESGHSIDEVATSDEESPVPAWIEHAGGVGTVAPGETSQVTMRLEPNTTYGFFCTESDEETNKGHADEGMKGSFKTGDASGADMPDADAHIVAHEYTFDMSGFKAGDNTVLFENTGKMLHHALVLPIQEGKTIDDVKKALGSEDESGPPPVDFEHGVFTAVFGSDSGVVNMNLKAGDYAVICFMPDKGTAGPPHIAKGMIKELKIS